jgi:hypothetical protein
LQRLTINLALNVNKLNYKRMEGAQNVKVEIITKIKFKGKCTANQKKKAEEGGLLHYFANTKSAKIYIASQPLTLISPFTTQFTYILDMPPPPLSQLIAFSTSLHFALSCSQFTSSYS